EIWMPGQPKRSEDVLDWGGKIYTYQVEVNNDLAYVVTATSVPTADQAASLAIRGDRAFHLKEAQDRVLKDSKGTLISEKAINYRGHIGFELMIRDPQGVTRYRQYHVGDQRHYQAFTLVLVSSKQADLTSKEADAFFQSFRVLKDVATAGAKATPPRTTPPL